MTLIGNAVGESHLLHFIEAGCNVRGVVHVGANDGQEIQFYLDHGCTPILCFEPNRDAYWRGEERWRGRPEVVFVNAALAAEAGVVEMVVPEDGDDEKTSRYQPIPTPGHPWTAVPPGRKFGIQTWRFDTWARLTSTAYPDGFPYNSLVIDVQGMEMEVLEGFGDYLDRFRYLIVELSRVPMYDGEVPASTVIAWLADRGFTQDSEVEDHGDVAFFKERVG